MSIIPWDFDADTIRSLWTDLERDWQSVTFALVVVALIAAFDVPIPW